MCVLPFGRAVAEVAVIGAPLTIRHENVTMEATVCELPFYQGGSLRS